MSKIFGYGEDAFTLWALKHNVSKILEMFDDKTLTSECMVFYRPSFGRHSRENSSVFGEFDAIIASKNRIYLIESKWDNINGFKNSGFLLRKEQTQRHAIFSWYLLNWNTQFLNNWQLFINANQSNFKFKGKTLAPNDSLLAKNLEFILNKLHENCSNFSEKSITNVLLFFFNANKSTPPRITSNAFTVVPIDYSQNITGNFVNVF